MPSRPLILFATSEMFPFSKSGGLGDVMGALPLSMHRLGYDVAVVTPMYGRMRSGSYPVRLLHSGCPVGYPWGPVSCDVYVANYHGLPVYFIDRAEYFDRRFYYCTHSGDYFDNCERFLFFSRAVLEWSRQLAKPPAVVHLHDWQTAVGAAFLSLWRQDDPYFRDTKSVLTIHNLAFQGRFSSRLFKDCGLPWSFWHMDGVEYHGDFNLLKAGIAYADAITTVSPSYAQEIATPEFGCGLEGILAHSKSKLYGILNGADYDVWNPQSDMFLDCPYSQTDWSGKRHCRDNLMRAGNLDERLSSRPILGFIGRLRRQKGIDLVIEAIPELMKLDVGVVVLGEGNPEFEQQLSSLMEDYPGRIWAHIGYTEELAHFMQAGCDIFMMPSRYEPCGLTQMYALAFGTPPVATSVGGLNDTIIPWPDVEATGFICDRFDAKAFTQTVAEAVAVWEDKPQWQGIMKRAMRTRFSWEDAVRGYVDVYRRLGVAL